jgi:hypothetical protein
VNAFCCAASRMEHNPKYGQPVWHAIYSELGGAGSCRGKLVHWCTLLGVQGAQCQHRQVHHQPNVPRCRKVLESSRQSLRGGSAQRWHPCSGSALLVCAPMTQEILLAMHRLWRRSSGCQCQGIVLQHQYSTIGYIAAGDWNVSWLTMARGMHDGLKGHMATYTSTLDTLDVLYCHLSHSSPPFA